MIHQEKFKIAKRVIEKIENAGFEAYIVGGAVRDFLLGKNVNDVDIATSALPNEIKSIFKSTVDIGIEHGTILVLDETEPFEVTTFRTDGKYEDFRRPEEVTFVRNLEEDLLRRDFTINAMAMKNDGTIIDLYGGQKDLKEKRIKAVGNPKKRFQEDALRMLRAVRFSAQLGFFIDITTLQAIKEECHLIEYIAKERIQMELSKMWTSPFVYNGVKYIVETGLSPYLLGNFEKSIEGWKQFSCTKSEVGWAYLSLNSDIQNDNIIKFYKLSNKDKRFIKEVLSVYEKLLDQWTLMDYFQHELEIMEIAYQFAAWQQKSLPIKKEDIQKIKSSLPIQSKDELAITGHQLLTWSNKKQGPWIKKALDEVLYKVISNQIENDEEKLKEWFLNEFNDEG